MAAGADEKTEAPTPRRRNEARAKGQVARSQDLTAAVLMFSAFVALAVLGPGLWRSLAAIMTAALSADQPQRLDNVLPLAGAIVVELIKRLGLFLVIVFLATLTSLYVQIGWLVTFQPLMPSLSKVSPLAGFKRLFSARSLMRAATSLLKLVLVAAVAYVTLASSVTAIVYSFSFGFYDIIQIGSALTMDLGFRLGGALLILALIDVVWQRYRHEKDLRMTKEEVKDELRSMEGDPQIKRRRRQLQLQLAAQQLQKDVPTADVIVTNPTHLSIAIRYDAAEMPAPKVVAKGADYLAIRIRQIAKEHGIPTIERKPLARALYETVEPGQYIPEKFYRAIAEILAYVYELTGRTPNGVRRGFVGA